VRKHSDEKATIEQLAGQGDGRVWLRAAFSSGPVVRTNRLAGNCIIFVNLLLPMTLVLAGSVRWRPSLPIYFSMGFPAVPARIPPGRRHPPGSQAIARTLSEGVPGKSAGNFAPHETLSTGASGVSVVPLVPLAKLHPI
jgi:hypothetical protein